MNVIYLILLLGLVPFVFADGEIPHQYVVRLKSPAKAEKIKEMILQSGTEIAAQGEEFLVIRPKNFSSKKEFLNILEELKKSQHVLSVSQDRVLYPRNGIIPEVEQCAESSSSGFIPSILDLLKNSEAQDCQLNPHCQGRNPQWAKYFIDADLADQEVKKILEENDSSDYAKVAVVDSGFNKEQNLKNLEAQKIKLAKGFEKAGSEFKDQSGHGTAVSGMISGKGVGVTSYVDLNIYRVTEDGASGATSSAFLAASIEKACSESDIVNVSWGSDFDELGITKIEDELWYKKAKELGCLVIKSSGNNGIKKKSFEQKVAPDAPVIFIGAINNEGQEATFSTVGDLKAPGEGVYTLVSEDAKNGEYKRKKQCQIDGVVYGPISGTSFSSPSTAAVAGQIVTVLKARKLLPQNPTDKVNLIKNILRASALGTSENVINAFRAVKMASLVNAQSIQDSPEKLLHALKQNQQNSCQKPVECQNSQSCEERKVCVSSLREKLSLCQGAMDRKNLILNLFQMNEKDLILGHLSVLEPGEMEPEELDKLLSAMWENNLERGAVKNVQAAINLLNLAAKLGRNNFLSQEKFKQIFESFDYKMEFNVFTDIGESVWAQGKEQLYPGLISVFSKMKQKDQTELIDFLKKSKSYNGSVSSETLSFLLIAKRHQDLLTEETKVNVEREIKNYSNDFLSGKMITDLETYQLDQTAIYDLLVLSDSQGKEKIKQSFSQGYSKNNVKFMTYAMGSDKILSAEEKLKYASQILMDSKGKELELSSAVQVSIDHLVDLEDLTLVDNIRQSLLTNPYLDEFSDFKLQFAFKETVKTKLLKDPVFWQDYTKFSLENAAKFVKGDLDDKSVSGKAISVLGSLIETKAIKDEDKKRILQDLAPLLKSAVEVSKSTIDKSVDKFSHRVYEAADIISEISDNHKWLKENNIFSSEEIESLKKFVQDNKKAFLLPDYLFSE